MTSFPSGPDPFLPPPGVAQSHGFRAGLPSHPTADRPVALAPLACLNFAAAVFVTFPLVLPPDVIREVATPLLTAATALTVAAIALALTYPRRRAGRRRHRHATASRAS
ncbi:hypothetical protein [Sanguibacter massiliensis]|uniref:hypothetical protein n=1 Tax=Sanguibacter massiliensis TaxID=1973217 RepID=UPI000C82E8D1|nr:hypothetical protein [Sanguibacter massiliensis]